MRSGVTVQQTCGHRLHAVFGRNVSDLRTVPLRDRTQRLADPPLFSPSSPNTDWISKQTAIYSHETLSGTNAVSSLNTAMLPDMEEVEADVDGSGL